MSKRIISVDLETMDIVASSSILSIGACTFDISAPTFTVLEKFYITVKLSSQEARTMSSQTLWWHMQQSKEVQEVFNPANAIPLNAALASFDNFCAVGVDEIWSKGADFDLAILHHAYQETCKMKTPWTYKATRCLRTLEALYPDVPRPAFQEGVAHNALADAIQQAEHIFNINVARSL